MTKYLRLLCLVQLAITSADELGQPKPKATKISGTPLKTGHYYSMYMSKFPNGFISWNNNTLDHIESSSIKVYKDASSFQTKQINKEWAFVPATGEPTWYHLVNHGRPGEFASWGKRKALNGNTSYIVMLKFPTNAPEETEHYLFRPVRPNVNVDVNKYQLKLKSFPNAIIKWTSIDDSIYLEIIHPTNATKAMYEKYTPEFINTLFTIKNVRGRIHAFASSDRVWYGFSNFILLIISIVFTLMIVG